MTDNAPGMVAGGFQAGNTCPACQRLIEENQRIMRCERCGALHHEMCWQVQQGCCSYHCDQRSRVNLGEQKAEIVIAAGDAAQVVPPPPPRRAAPEEAARPYLPPPPRRLSKLAVASAAAGGLTFLALAGVLLENWPLVIIGFAAALTALVAGVIALVIIYTGNRAKGLALAGVSVGAAALAIIASLVVVAVRERGLPHETGLMLGQNETPPTEEDLARMNPIAAAALRANVVVKAEIGGVLTRGTALSSGSVLRVVDNRAFILTNRHSVEHAGKKARQIEVLFYNGESSEATVEWLAPDKADVAIISCQAISLKAVTPARVAGRLGAQGEHVFAIGNPLSLCWSYSEGVICATRAQHLDGREVTIYQTQAPIRLGSSGGGLYDMAGTLIGVNTWVENAAAGDGLAFAISTKSLLEMLTPEAVKRFLAPAAPAPADKPSAPEPSAEAAP